MEIIVPSVAAPALLLAGLYICAMKMKRRRKEKEAIPLALLRNAQRQSTPFGRRNQIAASTDAQDDPLHSNGQGSSNQDCDLPSFDVETIQGATGNFSVYNKIGQGGFGPVYMVSQISVLLDKYECKGFSGQNSDQL